MWPHRRVFFLPPHLFTDLLSRLRIVVRWSRLRKESAVSRGRQVFFLLLRAHTFSYKGGTDNGLLRGPPESGSPWTTTSDGEAAVTFMHILLGCLVGTRCFPALFFPFSDALFEKKMQKRLLFMEGSPWRPPLFSEA
jgi:hypothetical protein